MKVQVTVDGDAHDVDVTLDSITLQESCDLEDALGPDGFERYQQGKVTPKVIRGLVWAKLRRQFPDIELADFDLEFTDALEVAQGDEPGPFDEN